LDHSAIVTPPGSAHSPYERAQGGFTLTELLVLIGVISILGSALVVANSGGRGSSKIAQCAGNLKQFAQALQIYGGENRGNLPPGRNGTWPWDLNWDSGVTITQWISYRQLYCPGTSVRFNDQANLDLWNYVPGPYGFHVIGYATTSPTGSLIATNWNSTLTPRKIQWNGSYLPAPSPAQRPLLADATISKPGQFVYTDRYSYNYTSIQGGFYLAHLTAHLSGPFPMGGNVAMLDGHVEWRRFDLMLPRTDPNGGAPVFWW
jgi:prepilin-type processing-associated H-X9-DG protein